MRRPRSTPKQIPTSCENVFEALPSAEELGESSVSDRVGHEEDSTQDEVSGNKTGHAVVLQPPASDDQKFSDKG